MDTNVLLYYFGGRSEQCRRFIERCLSHDINAYTSMTVLIEALHKLMIMEAIQEGRITGEGAVQKLRAHPEIVRSLSRYEEAIKHILDYFVDTVPLDVGDLLVSRVLRAQFGLLVNDSLIFTAMKKEYLTEIATADRDFRRLKGLNVYRPTDLTG